MVDKLRKAWNGRAARPRGNPAWQRAATYLEAAGYPDAAAELHRAARQPGGSFWTPHRLAAYTRAREFARHIGERGTLAGLAVDLYGAVEFMSAKALQLFTQKGDMEPAQVVAVHRAIADLACALLDLTDPGWRRREWRPEGLD